MNREYVNKLMRIYELNLAIMSEHDRWECYMNYENDEVKGQIEKTLKHMEDCYKDLFNEEMPIK